MLELPPSIRRDPEGLKAVLSRLVEGVCACLDDHCVGVYLQGSIATDGFDDHSDVDFFVAVRDELSSATRARLNAFHAELFGHPCYWARHLEGSYATLDDLATLPPPRRKLWYLDHGATTLSRSDHDHFLAVLWTLRERGVTLVGPPPDTLVPVIPPERLMDETRDTMRWWGQRILDDPTEMTQLWYAAFAVMNYCRMAHTLVTGEVQSKRHGVAWAREAMRPNAGEDADWPALIELAQSARREPWDRLLAEADAELLEQTKAFVRDVLARWT
ncbi:MAG: aminoglycoside adenylyltransferase domain-containing protein [Planctomycetota bacterium]